MASFTIGHACMRSAIATLPLLLALLLPVPANASGGDDNVGVFPTPQNDQLSVYGERTLSGDESGGVTPADDGPVMERYTSFDDYLCRSPTEVFVEHYQRPAGSDEPWELVSSGCELPG